jgi:hypothetical protein
VFFSTLGDIWRFEGYLSSNLHAKGYAYRFEGRSQPITEKNAILNEIRCYSATVGDILTFWGLHLLNFRRQTLCIPLSASKPVHNREKRNFDRNSLLFLNPWRYFDVLGLLLFNFPFQTLCMPHSALKPVHNREKRNFDRNLLLLLNRSWYFDVLRATFAQLFTPNAVHTAFSFENFP